MRLVIPSMGPAIAQRLVAGYPLRQLGFYPMSTHERISLDIVSLGQAFSEYFGFPH
jgi:hypothetical protein